MFILPFDMFAHDNMDKQNDMNEALPISLKEKSKCTTIYPFEGAVHILSHLFLLIVGVHFCLKAATIHNKICDRTALW